MTTVGLSNGLSTHSPHGTGQRTGSDARVVRQRPWHGGMRTIDCLGESRVRENRMHGLGRGDWGGRRPGEMEHAPEGKLTGLSPSAVPTTPNQFPTSPLPRGDLLCQVRLTLHACQSILTGMDIETLRLNFSSDDPTVGLRASLALHRLAERVEANQVASARKKGWSWQQIGDALGVTRQSVHSKYNKESS